MVEKNRILIIGVDKDIHKHITQEFVGEEYEFITTTHGKEGLIKLRESRINLIVLDEKLVDVDGEDPVGEDVGPETGSLARFPCALPLAERKGPRSRSLPRPAPSGVASGDARQRILGHRVTSTSSARSMSTGALRRDRTRVGGSGCLPEGAEGDPPPLATDDSSWRPGSGEGRREGLRSRCLG